MKIEGFFSNIKKANDTIKQLKGTGFKKAYLDLNDHYDTNRNNEINQAGTENSASLADLVLGSGSTIVSDRSKAPLAAASPMVSGMGKMSEVADVDCKVVVEAEDNNIDNAKKIIRDMGGSLDNPNVDEPHVTGNEDKVFDMAFDKLKRNL